MLDSEEAGLSSKAASTREMREALLLAITPEQETASAIETRLRDAGQNVRVDWLGKPESLGSYVSDHAPALICCQAGAGKPDGLKRLLGLCLNTASGTPVVLIEDTDADSRGELMRAGARDVVAPDAVEHLTAVLVRELDVARLHDDAEAARSRLVEVERRLEAVVAESQDARATLQEGIHARLNATYARRFGFEAPEELEGVPLMDLVVPSDRDRVKRKLTDCRKGKDDGEPIRFTGQRADDSTCKVLMHFRSVQVDGEDAVEILIPQAAASGSGGADDSARGALYHALTQPAEAVDEVAGLQFLVVDDLDGLRDRLGLAKSDRVLDELALFLLDSVAEHDQCFRFGAGEFVVLCTRDSVAELQAAAEALRSAIDTEVFGDDDVSSSLTVSIAVTSLPPGSDQEALLLSALRRAYDAASDGGNKVVLEAESEQIVSSETEDQKWLTLLQGALREDRVTFAYQSIASLEGDDSEHFDVLIRLVAEDGEIVHPRDFVDSARRHGLTRDLDRHVVGKALGLVAQRHERGTRGMLFVKLSDATLEDAPAFLDWLRESMSQFQHEPRDLRFSLSEDSLRSNVRRGQQLAAELKEMGLGLAIEHFGSTGKSIQLLERVPADFAKLDAALTEALAGNDSDPKIGEAVQAARERGVRLVAQQVADANTMARLWQLGINYIQGQSVQEPDVAELQAASGE